LASTSRKWKSNGEVREANLKLLTVTFERSIIGEVGGLDR